MTMFSCTMSLRSVSSFRRLVFPSVSRVSLCTSVSAWNFPWKSTWYLTCESALWIFHRASCRTHTNGKLIHVFHTDSRWTAIYWAHGNPCLGLSDFTLEKRIKHRVQRLGYEQCLRSLLALYNWQRSPLRAAFSWGLSASVSHLPALSCQGSLAYGAEKAAPTLSCGSFPPVRVGLGLVMGAHFMMLQWA